MTNITPLPNRHTSRIRPSHRLNMLLLDHWRQLSADDAIPARQRLNLRAIAPALSCLGLVHERNGRYLWRLAGSSLCATPQGELTGREVLKGWHKFEQQTLNRLFDRTIGSGRPALVRLNFNGGRYGGEMLILPLRDAASGERLLMVSLMAMNNTHVHNCIDLPSAELTTVRVLPPLPPVTAQPPSATLADNHSPFLVIEGGKDFSR